MILVDTTELMRPTQRKLHAAWQELQGQQVLATPSVAKELAPLAVDVPWMGRPSDAELASFCASRSSAISAPTLFRDDPIVPSPVQRVPGHGRCSGLAR